MCLMRNPFHFPQYVPNMTDALKRKEWKQQGEIEIIWPAKWRKEKNKEIYLCSQFL